MSYANHECQLIGKTNEMLFYPGENRLKVFFGRLRLFFMVSLKNPHAKRYFRSRADYVHEKRRHLRYHTGIIHPFSTFRLAWEIFMIIAIAFALTLIPYQAAFDTTRSNPGTWLLVKNALISFSWLDIVVNSLTGYLDTSQGFIELKQSRIIDRYVKHGTFVPDLLGSLPTDAFFAARWNELTVARELSSLMYVLRIFSMSKYIASVARAYDMPRALHEFSAMIFWLFMMLHWMSCVYWIVPIAVASAVGPLKKPKTESWINVLSLWDNASPRFQYFHGLYRAFVTFTRSGFRSASPKTAEDQCTVLILQLFCILVFCLFVAKMMLFVQTISNSRFHYEAKKLKLQHYMTYKQLPRQSQRRFVAHYEYKFQQNYLNEYEITGNLTTQMRQEIRMHSCRKLVENVVFFDNLPLPILVRIVSLLHSEIYLTDDVICKYNQIGDCMYFIAAGTVAVYTSSGKEVCHLESRGYFGEIALVMPDERRVATVLAVETCKLYRLDRADFVRTVHPDRLLWEQVKKIAYQRMELIDNLNAD